MLHSNMKYKLLIFKISKPLGMITFGKIRTTHQLFHFFCTDTKLMWDDTFFQSNSQSSLTSPSIVPQSKTRMEVSSIPSPPPPLSFPKTLVSWGTEWFISFNPYIFLLSFPNWIFKGEESLSLQPRWCLGRGLGQTTEISFSCLPSRCHQARVKVAGHGSSWLDWKTEGLHFSLEPFPSAWAQFQHSAHTPFF